MEVIQAPASVEEPFKQLLSLLYKFIHINKFSRGKLIQMKRKISSGRIVSLAGLQIYIFCKCAVGRITICQLGLTAKWQVCTNTNVLTTAQFWAQTHNNGSSQKEDKILDKSLGSTKNYSNRSLPIRKNV